MLTMMGLTGPIVRISPDEIHLSDPENYEKIYYIGSKAPSKASYFYSAFGLKTAGFGTLSNELHRVRRGALNPLFSKKAVLQLEDVVQSKVEKLLRRAKEKLARGESVDLHHGFRALSVDIITDYAFDNCYNQLDSPDFASEYFHMTRQLLPRGWFLQAFPLLLPITNLITPNMAKRINIYLYRFLEFRQVRLSLQYFISLAFKYSQITTCLLHQRCTKEIASVKQKIDQGREESARKTIFHQLLDPAATEGHVVPNVEDLTDEAFTILTAAADTTGHAMTMTSYYVISNPKIYHNLTVELERAFPDPSSKLEYNGLEKLPYLTAVIREGLRLSFGVPGRLPRMVETQGVVLNGYSIQRGTIVGMSSWMMHRNPKIFPDPDTFVPERWLDPANVGKLEKSFVAFSRGSRQCIGMQ
jgi:cytochrome P450